MMRTNWLCGCGNGLLGVEPSEIPEECEICGLPTPSVEREDWRGLECVDHQLTERYDTDGNGYTACNKCGGVWHSPDSIHYEGDENGH